MKGAVLTFVGLFILGCIVGIVQVLVILHVRSKRSGKQPGGYDIMVVYLYWYLLVSDLETLTVKSYEDFHFHGCMENKIYFEH